ncbi:hypothetical protein [Streptomyces sp. NBC_01373]|uniref:hypothetical protein n=1 Tax=Streptomyces sp. NBC_01373 TaxID=2903843 RepID=UPI00225BF0BE|nr:hypothetical protein [Streptomyces sp. NBC_01373]MCX4705639.1 hypothetical protein [Streptomyces sp. NBC_01373]
MGDTARPVEGRPDQDEQARLITRTGNGPTVDDEVELLAAEYGPADMAGVFSGSGEPAADVDQDEAEVPVDEAPAEGGKDASA